MNLEQLDFQQVPRNGPPGMAPLAQTKPLAESSRRRQQDSLKPTGRRRCPPAKETVFRLAAAAAKNVHLAADFTDWNKSPLKMVKDKDGIWHLRVNLAPGRYRYKFLIDLDSPKDSHAPRPLPFGTLQGVVDVRA
jgi:1,4-alpha-glucan branching enzyme